MTTVLIILLVLAVAGAGFGQSNLGWAGWSPAVLLLFVLLVLLLSRHL